MGCHTRVINLTTGRRIKRNQALGRIDQCLSTWVDEGYSIRDLSLQEIVSARSEKARLEESLPFAEIPGIIFQHGDGAQIRMETRLAAQANRFAAQTAIQ